MSLFAHRFTTAPSSLGDVEAVKTQAEADRPDASAHTTRGGRDATSLIADKTAGGRDREDARGALAASPW
jgi:hypothetical protein